MDFFNSFFQNVKDKLTSPFFGALTVILIIHHWEFWYTLLNFEKNTSRISKITTLKCISNFEFTWVKLSWDVAYAILVVLIGYIVVIATRTLTLFIEHRIMPRITKSVINKLVVLKTVHEEVVKERDEYAEKYEEQRKNVRNLSKDYDIQTDQIKTKDEQYLKKNAETIKLSADLSESKGIITDQGINIHDLEKTIETKKTETSKYIDLLANEQSTVKTYLEQIELFYELFTENQIDGFYSKIEHFPPAVITKYEELKKMNLWSTFLGVVNFFNKGGGMSSSTIELMQEHGLVSKFDDHRLTPLGFILGRYRGVFINS